MSEIRQGQSRRLANPGPLGFGAFATTLMTISLAQMGFRNVQNQTVFVANLCFLAGVGLLISAQWEMVRGDTFAYTVLTAFAFYYGGYGALLMPWMGVVDSYGGKTIEYYNAFGLYLCVWSVLNLFFFVASLSTNIANMVVYGGLEISYMLNCAANFSFADGYSAHGQALTKAAGAFGFIASLAGFYVLAHELCQDSLRIKVPLGETRRWVERDVL
ncbi:hypothetical protein D6C88_08209 [Aureobasidium pullulans]|uniref:Uncharacterized protein n=1 Tax=Aureobasidium pullulans TaxID=5580 RepID=A0AB38LXH5_AURPU|nr:hypothetical protein D6C94_05096 [Aureobasidium pullulans]THZ66603.1 hypothetical protein D6C88_08209 [Aureobasidium pullulans]